MGSIFSGLTKSAVSSPGGPANYYDSPQAATEAASKQLPSASSLVDNTDPIHPVVSTPSNLPTVSQPTVAQASSGGAAPFSPGMTTKGKILSGLLLAAQGAANGASASLPINGGRTSVGIGPGAAAGFQTPLMLKQQQNEMEKEGLANQMTRAQMSMLPLQRMKDLATIRKDQLVTPRGGGVFDANTNAYVPGTEPQDKNQNVDNLIAAASAKAVEKGVDPSQDPTVKQLAAVKAASAKVTASEEPLGSRVPQLNDALKARYQVLNPNKPLPSSLTLAPDATSKDFDRVDKIMQQTESSSATKAQQDTVNSIRQRIEGDNRLDKSYQFNQSRLDKTRTPVDALAARFGRLQDTLSQGSPQADALVAPELLTIMAGGQGSGLRMNEAEISRIVGGRSKWQDLQAAINKWQTDPSKANSITPDQRAQIHALVDTVGKKITAKQGILSDAQDQLLDAPDVKGHRKVLADTQNKLDSIDGGSAAPNAGAGKGNTSVAPNTDPFAQFGGKAR